MLGLGPFPGGVEASQLRFNRQGLTDGRSNGLKGFEAIARDVGNGGLTGVDFSLLDQLFEHCNCGAAGGFGKHAFGFGQELDSGHDFLVTDGCDRAAGAVGDVDGVGAIGRVTNCDRFCNRIWFYRGDEIPAFSEGLGDG